MYRERLYPGVVFLAALACLALGQVDVEVKIDGHRSSKESDRKEHNRSEGKITYHMDPIPFLSDKSKKELKSGISTRIGIMAELIENPERIILQQITILESKFDLWEEVFFVTQSDGVKRTIADQKTLEDLIEGPGPFELAPVSILSSPHTYQIRLVETVNPLSEERFEAVQKWITQHKLSLRGLPSSKDSLNPSSDLETSLSALFYNLWKRASSGEILSGELRREVRSEIFSADTLPITGFPNLGSTPQGKDQGSVFQRSVNRRAK